MLGLKVSHQNIAHSITLCLLLCLKVNMIHQTRPPGQTRPPFSIAPWSSSHSHMPIVGTFSCGHKHFDQSAAMQPYVHCVSCHLSVILSMNLFCNLQYLLCGIGPYGLAFIPQRHHCACPCHWFTSCSFLKINNVIYFICFNIMADWCIVA